jgi:hypothetical protein
MRYTNIVQQIEIRQECSERSTREHIVHSVQMEPLNEIYEAESVNRFQMDIKRKTCDIRICKKHLFLDISSTNTDIFVPQLY